MGFLESVFRRKSEVETLFDLDFTDAIQERNYLKKMALETCLNFVGRTISQCEFRITKDNKKIPSDWDYLLNVRPNTDQSAAEFWHQLSYRLIYDNEVLVILSDSNDLLIADSFSRDEYAVFEDVFRDVTVKDYTFKRTFRMGEVIYLTYNNEKLIRYMDPAFNDYSSLYGRMVETQKMSNQIRGIVEMDATKNLDDENRTKLQNYIDKLFSAFKNSIVALVPQLKGLNYKEINNGSNNGRSVEELSKLKHQITDDVAIILGIPTSLVHGDMSDFETAIKAYIKFCYNSLIKKIRDELQAKLLSKSEYTSGTRVQIRGIAEKNPLELAAAVDKLRSSGTYSGNEIRIKLGDEPVDNPALDEYVITKNYQSVNAEEGGEKEK